MGRGDTVAAVRDICDSIVVRHGMELVDVTLQGTGRRRVLAVVVDRIGQPVNLQEITEVSEEISRALDIEDPIDGSYMLEVSSAGIERPLIKPSDYVRFTGREVRVKLHHPIEGRRNFQGQIQAAGGETFVLADASGVVELPYASVAKAKLVVDWDEELKKSGSEVVGPSEDDEPGGQP